MKETLDALCDRFNRPEFIVDDPVSIPHGFSKREDIEIAGFLAATIAWGNRKMILRNARCMMELMDNAPHDFIVGASEREFDGFVHRTFNSQDFKDFITALRRMEQRHGGLGGFFEKEWERTGDMKAVLAGFYNEFEGVRGKHVSCVERGGACKRLNMFLRWMVRRDGRGVDFGLWTKIPTSALYLPLDVHSGRTARALGLLNRKQDDWRAVEEVTYALRTLDPADPVKYDFALFGLGVNS